MRLLFSHYLLTKHVERKSSLHATRFRTLEILHRRYLLNNLGVLLLLGKRNHYIYIVYIIFVLTSKDIKMTS